MTQDLRKVPTEKIIAFVLDTLSGKTTPLEVCREYDISQSDVNALVEAGKQGLEQSLMDKITLLHAASKDTYDNKKQTLEQYKKSIDGLHKKLEKLYRVLYDTYQLEDTFEIFCGDIETALTSYGSARNIHLHNNFFNIHLSRDIPDSYIIVILFSYAYSIDSLRSITENNPEKAEEFLQKSKNFLDEAMENETIGYDKSQSSYIAKKGGNARSKKIFGPIKAKLIELLVEKRPKEGWKDINDFIKTIEHEIYEFQRENGRPLSWDNLPNTLKKWIIKDKEIYEIFKENKKPSNL